MPTRLRSTIVCSALAVILPMLWPGGPVGAVPTTPAVPGDGPPVTLRPLHTDQQRRIVDDLGRTVLLRGANLNSLGEYWQGDPSSPATLPVTDRDWADMAANGFSVVRLVVSWSRVEPSPGNYDEGYLDEIDRQIRTAATHGIYTVIDMHQDAFSAFISTPAGAECPAGLAPAKGWDGAPPWAVITDGAQTCTPGERNASDAVRAAWNHFYDNTSGIADRFAAMWGHVAGRFAGRPEVAGFDLLNEPEVPAPASEIGPKYGRLMVETITAIRAAETGAPFEHLLIVEPALPAGNPDFGLVIPDAANLDIDLRNVVAGPHNYAESIPSGLLPFTVAEMNGLIDGFAAAIGVPVWIGEYGYWSTSADSLDAARRQALDDDARGWGGAWWQWRQACGDPHAVSWNGTGWQASTSGVSVHLNRVDCATSQPDGPTPEFLSIAGRGYPRAAPGTLTSILNDLDARTTTVTGLTADSAGSAWRVASVGSASPQSW